MSENDGVYVLSLDVRGGAVLKNERVETLTASVSPRRTKKLPESTWENPVSGEMVRF